MGNPDLELQNPARDPRHQHQRWPNQQRRRRRDSGIFTAVAAGLLLAIGVWGLCSDATTRSLQRLQYQCAEGGGGCFAPGSAFQVFGGASPGDGHVSDGISSSRGKGGRTIKEKAEKCAISNLQKDTSFLDNIKGIPAREFLHRRDKLAQVLHNEGVEAFVAEPGFTFEYYANVSQSDWEPVELDERPFLMIIQPVEDHTGAVVARTAFLAPHFEVPRVRMLPIPSSEPELDIVAWEEHWSPYDTLRRSHLFPAPEGGPDAHSLHARAARPSERRPTIVVDREMRNFIAGALRDAGFRFRPPSHALALIPQVKSDGQVAILRAVNTASLAAVRAVRPCLVPGLTEADVASIVRHTLGSIGLTPFINTVLFDANGALPHGGAATGDKVLAYDSMVTVEVGAHYMGHSSEVGRSFSIDGPSSGKRAADGRGDDAFAHSTPPPKDPFAAEKQIVWRAVRGAQEASAKVMVNNGTAAEVDLAARAVIEHAGYGYAFTHRVGHGIGVRAREAPYLSKANRGEHLRPGMVFVNEPGIYLEERFGVRLADVYLVNEDGEPDLLSGGLSKGLDDP